MSAPPLRQAFTATALVTLGLSLKTNLRALSSAPLFASCLLLGKLVLLPIFARLAAILFAIEYSDSRCFVFLYAMLRALCIRSKRARTEAFMST